LGCFFEADTWKNSAKSPLQVIFWPLYQGYFGSFPVVLGGVLRCLRVFTGGLEYFGAENMLVRPFCGALSRPILGKNSAKSPLQVIFGPCIKAILGVFEGYWGVF
jgi:hypothetical protein